MLIKKFNVKTTKKKSAETKMYYSIKKKLSNLKITDNKKLCEVRETNSTAFSSLSISIEAKILKEVNKKRMISIIWPLI